MIDQHQAPRWRNFLKWAAILVGVLLVALLVVLVVAGLKPIQVENPVSSLPAASYEEALSAVEAMQAQEDAIPDLFPECRSLLMTHDEKVEDVIVFYHSFTSCPEQFRVLGEQFFERGYSVFVPLQPYHGRSGRTGWILENLTAEDLAGFSTHTADIAQGLGDEVTISGVSGGGSLAVWLAQERDDVDVVAPISPFVGIKLAPGLFLNKVMTNLIPVAPNFYRWWDPITKEDNPKSAPYTYVGYPFRTMGEYMKLGFAAENAAQKQAPAAAAIVMITNGNESSISNGVVDHLVGLWNDHKPGVAETYEFEKSFGYPHDIISITRQRNDPAVVYPILLELMGAGDS